MGRPTLSDDGWWLALLCVEDERGVISFRDVAPRAGAPPERGRERSGADDEPPESDADSDPMLSANDGTRETRADGAGADEAGADEAGADEAGADGPDDGEPEPTPLRGPRPGTGSSRTPGGGSRGPTRRR